MPSLPINTTMVPPRGWSVDVGLGPPIVSHNFNDFVRQIFVRLQANDADKHGWRDWALSLMCEQRPDIPCEDSAKNERAMTGDDVLRFLKSLWTAKEEGAVAVSEELQNKRVDTCLACPKLGYISCYVGCASISETLSAFLLGRKVPRIREIHKMSCMACGCSAEVKTMWPLDIIRQIDEKHGTKPDYHEKCWVLTEPQEVAVASEQPPE